LRPRAVSSEGDEYFVEEVVGWKIERGREFFLIKWAGYSDDYNTWENGQEKRREIPNMVADYFDELGVTDDEDNFDNTKDITYIIVAKNDVYCKYFFLFYFIIIFFSFS
jgi:hypothetical protein